MGAGCHTQVSVPSLEHQNQFELWSIVQKSTCFHSVPTSLYKTASCSALYPTLVSVLFTAQLFSHVGHIEIDILYCLHLEKLPTWASTGSRTGWMVSPPGVEMSKMSTMSTWWADNSKSENRNPTNTAGKPRSPGQANTCRIPEIWLSFSCLKFTCIEGRRLWRGGFRRWGNWCSPTTSHLSKWIQDPRNAPSNLKTYSSSGGLIPKTLPVFPHASSLLEKAPVVQGVCVGCQRSAEDQEKMLKKG